MRRGIISLCQSDVTSEIVKRCCSSLCKQRYRKYSVHLPTFNDIIVVGRCGCIVLSAGQSLPVSLLNFHTAVVVCQLTGPVIIIIVVIIIC